MECRLMAAGRDDPYADFALEEAIFRELNSATVRVWQNRLSVIIGRAQLARLETDLDYCAAKKIPVVRRFTAGGAVYNGPGNLNWSFFIPSSFRSGGLVYTQDAGNIFRMVSSVVIEALRACGVKSWFDPPNRIVIQEGKISGMAAYISKDALLCHGTLLAEADLDVLRRLTTPVRNVAERRYVRSNFTRVANTGIRYGSFVQFMKEVLQERTGIRFESTQPSGQELDLAQILYGQRYARDEWNLGDPFAVGGGLA